MWPFTRKKKEKLRTRLLKKLRWEAVGKLNFIGRWSGYWTTTIMGVHYRSNTVSGFNFVVNDCGSFIQDAIIDRCKLLRNKDANEKAEYMARCGRKRYINANGDAEEI